MRPIFDITEEMLSLVADISERIGHLTASRRNPGVVLRKANRIRTIQGSLAIEQNTLTVEQVTAVLNGKTVLAPPKDVAAVQNAYEIYEHLELLDPTSQKDLCAAHGVMMRGLTTDAGAFRTIPVGVVNQKNEIVHFGTLPNYIPNAMEDLFGWLKETNIHPLIKAAVFHYEFELIHPFSDGNGRMGRLWHTLILSEWNPLFSWLPVESIISKHQEEYYDAINVCNEAVNDTAFIIFMLNMIVQALRELSEQDAEQDKGQDAEQVDTESLLRFCREPRTRQEMQAFCRMESRKKFCARILHPLLASGTLIMTIPDKINSKNQKYISKQKP